MHVFYQPDLSANDILLNEEESKHCIRVLRMKTGDEVHLADGKGIHAIAVVAGDHPKKCLLQIRSKELSAPARNYRLHIVVAPTKNTDRIEWFIEKATEAGIDEITFIETENSERSRINMERCEKIAVSAMKQSKQWYLPRLNGIISFKDLFAQHLTSAAKYMAWCETASTELLTHRLKQAAATDIVVLIGPEGDFTAAEVQQASSSGFVPVSLGSNILRTETAALYACMAAKSILE
jgi:16S rRNA (uracil1498-N3)-methyltransferase